MCPYPIGVAPGQRLKFEQYYDDWRARGWEVDVAPFMDAAMWRVVYRRGHLFGKILGTLKGYLRRLRDLARARRYDLVYSHMYVTPLGGAAFEKLARKASRRLIFDLEDNNLLRPNREGNPNPVLSIARSTAKVHYLVRTADHVITSAPALNETCRALNRFGASTYVTSSVDTDRFVPANDYSNSDTVVIGWTGTFSTRLYLDLLRDVFHELATRRPFKLRIIGNFDYELPGVDLEVVQWTREREVADLQGVDIGVYPLPPDDWASGKSGLKAIQYMAFGLPCVATEVDTAPMIIQHDVNGLLVRTHDEWIAALERLIDDPLLRRRLGEEARRTALARFSTKAVASTYREILSDVMDAPAC